MKLQKLLGRLYKAMGFYVLIAALLIVGVIGAPNKVPSIGGVAETLRGVNTRGNIYDRNQTAIVWNASESGPSEREYMDGELYQPFVGYYSRQSGRISGLERLYDETLLLSDADKTKGNSLVLTVEAGLQRAISSAMATDAKGSCVVLNASTGEILGMLSNPSFDPKKIDSIYSSLQKSDVFVNKATAAYIPGSVMKIATAASIVRNDLEDEQYHDSGAFRIESFTVVNNANAQFGNVALREGLGFSVNTYFAYMSQMLGHDAYEQTLKSFLVGERIGLDFDFLSSEYNISTPLKLAVTSYGQGETTISAMQMAMITSSVATKGTMYKPYLVKEIIGPNGNTASETSPVALSEPLTRAEAEIIASGMKISAERVGLSAPNGIYSKTGTAETGVKGKENLWLTCYFDHKGTPYTITMMLVGRKGTGSDLGPAVQKVADYIMQNY
ncbi:MAG: penicillin-binding transpeptidase domain-containing protein [Eubacteriaceae bacterium]|nr:penicillin-binding transpeptidase domain-containing protein [Eubacteriaceae bacterium]